MSTLFVDVKDLIEVDPSALYERDENGCLPISSSRDGDMLRLCLESAIKFDPSHPSVGGLFAESQEGSGQLVIGEIIDRVADAAQVISTVLSPHMTFQLLTKHSPKLLDKFITKCPHAAFEIIANNMTTARDLLLDLQKNSSR